MEKTRDQPTPTVSKTWLIGQIKMCLSSSDYSRALELLRGAAAEFPQDDDPELSELEKLAHDGVKRNAEANRLITESQDLFAQRKSAEAIQLLRQAYELDKKNSLARSILANALVEHAQSVVETDWLEAEKLTHQALALNPAHPTAKTIHSLIIDRKTKSSVEDWVARAQKLQSSGDLFAALAWVAEGMAVHPDDPKLVQIHDAIQRDQNARRRQARRGDLEDLRRLQSEIDAATDVAGKQALAVRIQTLAAKHWTDGEILSIANALLLRLGLVAKGNPSAAQSGKSPTVILHVPRPSAPEASRNAARLIPATQAPPNPAAADHVPASPVPPRIVPSAGVQSATPQAGKVTPSEVRPRQVPPTVAPPFRVSNISPAPPLPPQPAAPAEPFASPVRVASPSSMPQQATKSNATTRMVSAAAIIIVAVASTFFFTREHYAPPVAQTQFVAPSMAAPVASGPTVSAPDPTLSTPSVSAPAAATPSRPAPEPPLPAPPASSDAVPEKVAAADHSPAESSRNLGALDIVAGQDDAKVFLDGKVQRQLTRAGQLLLPNLEPKDYVVQVSKSGFQDPPKQTIRIRKSEQARLVFSLQPQPRLASLSIQSGAPGTAVLVDQTLVGIVQPDGSLSVSTVSPGDHTIELRKDRFNPRQFKKHFDAGGLVSLAAAEAALEAAPSELKINFAPADARVVVVKGDLLKLVSSGVPLNLSPGTYTLTARTVDRFTRSSTLEVIAGQSKTLDLSLTPNGMSKWDDPAAWKHEGDSFIHRGGDFVLYGVAPTSGTFAFSAMPAKGRLLQWVFNYIDPSNYVLFQLDENNFYRTVIQSGVKSDEIIVPDKGDKKSVRILQIRVSSGELVHQIKHGDRWIVLDRWTQPGANPGAGKFGFYIPGNDEVALSSFVHYADLNLR